MKINNFRGELTDNSGKKEALLGSRNCDRCNERLGNDIAVCVHCAVDCPQLWPKLDHFFKVVKSSASFLAETSVRSPQKLFNFII